MSMVAILTPQNLQVSHISKMNNKHSYCKGAEGISPLLARSPDGWRASPWS
jgi:hypothetical protein